MRVLVIIDSLTLGGAERVLQDLARSAPKADLQLTVASLAPPSESSMRFGDTLRAAKVEVTSVPVRRLADPTAIPRLARAVRASGCEIVHAHLGAACTLGGPAARLARRPIVSTFHHVPGHLTRRELSKERLAVRTASRGRRVVFVSEASRRAFAARYGDHDRWVVVRNGVDVDAFAPGSSGPVDLAGAGDAGRRLVSLVAALRPGKGHAALLAAWPAVVARVPDAHLLIVGDGALEVELRADVARRGLEAAVTFLGFRRDVSAILAASALVVLPSEAEALPTVLMEASACGVPVVATRVGGVPEVVDEGVNGLLVPLGDDRALTEAVAGLLGDEERRRAMGAAARSVAIERFSAVDWARRLAVLYAECVA